VRRLVAIAVIAALLVAAAVLAGVSAPTSDKRSYRIVFDNAFGLTEGGDFRVGGVRAGKTPKFTVQKQKGRAPKAVAIAEITQPGFDDFRKDATCAIKPQSLIGEYYVDCQPGTSAERLPTDGSGTVPVEQTESTIPADLVNDIMRRPYRERFRLVLTELGTGLAGRPQDLQEVLKRAHPGLRETSRVLRILGDQNRIIENFITDSDTVVGELERNKRDVVRFVREAGDAAEISASRRERLAEGFRKLPDFLRELEPTMTSLGNLADEQTPLLADLQRAAPDLNTFFTRLGPFSEASRPAIRSLGEAGVKGRRAFREGVPEVDVLRELAPEVKPTFKPLRQFLETMDDRRRALENDPRAKNGSPPAPDPTAIRGEGGFTGLEAIWNYFYWQGLDLNGYDDISHMLRAGLTITECTQLDNEEDPNSEKFKECSQWLGPNLPGITSDDFTEGGSAARLAAESGKPARRVGERRAAGEPDAGPLPGQRDISQPQVTLPPGVQQLLDDLPRTERRRARERLEQAPQAPQGVAPTDPSVLDFLLAP
jgi:phospholipid/cholesterol/gamma-HCH transport system substrate-binding protein